MVNEAAIISARDNKESVDTEAFERAAERVLGKLIGYNFFSWIRN